MTVMNLSVETVKDTNGQLQIRKVNVQAAVPAKSEGTKQETTGPGNPLTVKPFQPVDISIQPKTEPVFGAQAERADKTADGGLGKGTEKEDGTGTTQEQTQIKMLLSKEWQVPMEHITVNVSAADGKSKY
jgi:stage III sporulation protein AF